MKRLMPALIVLLFLGGCVCAPGPRQTLSESLTHEDKDKIVKTVREHRYDRAEGTSWTNLHTGNSYTMYPRWRNDDQHIFALHAVVDGKSKACGQLIQGYGHAFQSPQGPWMVSDKFADIQMLNGQDKRVYNRNRFYLKVTK